MSSKPTPEAPGAEPDLVASFRALATATVSDALDALGLAGGCTGLHPLVPGPRIVGPALTLRYLPSGTSGGNVGDFLHLAKPGDVVVIDNAGRRDCTTWGGILSELAKAAGLAGTVIYGVSRDADRSIELGYPIFGLGAHMITGKGRISLEEINGPVALGTVRVEARDIIVADVSGVVVVPRARAAEVLAIATEIDAAERRVVEDVKNGTDLATARAAHRYHHLQDRR
jgi:4-hydroxy-4-methyl-2-oxoglutarate aldolase